MTGSAGNIMTRSADGDCPDGHACSEKGFYACDWLVWDGPYERLSSLAVPVSVGQLPVALRAVVRLAEFSADFADEPEITVKYIEPGSTQATPLPPD